MKEHTPITALRAFFGQKEGQTLNEFVAEMKELSEEEKVSLAQAACDEMGAKLILKREEKKDASS